MYRRLRVVAAILNGGSYPLANCIQSQPFQTTALHLWEELAWNSSPCSWTPCLRQGWSHTPHPASEGEVQFWMKNGVSRCNPVSSRRNSKWWGDFISTRMGNGNKQKEIFRWLINLVLFAYAHLVYWITFSLLAFFTKYKTAKTKHFGDPLCSIVRVDVIIFTDVGVFSPPLKHLKTREQYDVVAGLFMVGTHKFSPKT